MPTNEETVTLRLKAVNEADRDLAQHKKAVEDLTKSYREIEKTFDNFAKSQEKSQRVYTGYVDSMVKMNKTAQELSRAKEGEDNAARRAAEAHEKYDQALSKVKAHTSELTSELTGMVGRFASVAAVIETVRRGFVEYAGVARGMERVRLETGATKDQVDHLEHSFDYLAKMTGESLEKLTKNFRVFSDQTRLGFDEASKVFAQVVTAAHVAGASTEALANATAAAIVQLKVPADEVSAMLDDWVRVIPSSMQGAFGEAGPRIMATLRAMGLSGREAATQIGTEFANLGNKMAGGPREAAAQIESVLTRSKDFSTMLGKMMIPMIEGFRGAPDEFEKTMGAFAQTVSRLGLLNPNMGLAEKSMIQRQYGVTDRDIEQAKAWYDQQELIAKVAKDTGLAYSEVKLRIEEMNKGPQASLDGIQAVTEKIFTQIGKIFMMTGIPNALLQVLDSTVTDFEKILKVIEKIQEWTNKTPEERIKAHAEAQKESGFAEAINPFAQSNIDAERKAQEAQKNAPPPGPGRQWWNPWSQQNIEAEEKAKPGWDLRAPGSIFGLAPRDEAAEKRKQDEEAEKKLIEDTARKYRPKMALGGEFKVPGSGPSDTTPVEFMGTPGEKVTVEPQAELKESLQRQQDKADTALREHFARFHDAKRTAAFTPGAGEEAWSPTARVGAGGRGTMDVPGGGGGAGGGAGGGGGGGVPGSGGGVPGAGADPGGEPRLNIPTSSEQAPETLEAATQGGFLKPGAITGGGGAAFLAQQRAGFAQEMQKDPQLRTYFAQVVAKEARGGIEATAVAESVLNRAAASGITLRQALSGKYARFFGPINRGEVKPLSAEGYKVYNEAISNSLSSNLTLGSTDQGMAKEINSPFRQKVDREWFGDWGGGKGFAANRAFREQLQRGFQEAERAGGPVVAGAPQQMTTAGLKAALGSDAVGGGGDSRVVASKDALKGVNPVLVQAMHEGSKFLPEGYTMRPTSGLRPGDSGYHGRGQASDWQIYDPQGKPLPNRGFGDAETKLHSDVARGAYGWLLKNHPEEAKRFEWGGAFPTGKNGSGPPDLMHYDFGGRRGRWASRQVQAMGPLYGDETAKKLAGPTPTGEESPLERAARERYKQAEEHARPSVAPSEDEPFLGGRAAGKGLPLLGGRAAGKRPAPVARAVSPAGREERAAGKRPAPVARPVSAPGSEERAAGKRPAPVVRPVAAEGHEEKAAGKGLQQGGPFGAGDTNVVGEAGPELVTWGQSGTVHPNNALGDFQKMREQMMQPIEPIVRPRFQSVGPANMRWQRTAERKRQIDTSRDQARSAHTDTGFA